MENFSKILSVVKETTENFIKEEEALSPRRNFMAKEEERLSDDFTIVREIFELNCPKCGAIIGHVLVKDERGDDQEFMDTNYSESKTLIVECPWCKNQKLKLSF